LKKNIYITMKRHHQKIFLSFFVLTALILQTLPVGAQQIEFPATTAQDQNLQDRANNFNVLLQQGRGAELKGLLAALFGSDAEAAQKALDEKADELFRAVGDAGAEKNREVREEEIKDRKDNLKIDFDRLSPKKNARLEPLRAPLTPKRDWRAFAFGFQPFEAVQDGKPDVKITQSDKEIKAEGKDEKNFETDKASLKRTQKAESKFIKDGEVFGVEIKHTETIEGKSKTGSQYFRKETLMMWSARVAACPDVKGITAGTGKGSVTAKTTITDGSGATATVTRTVAADTKTTGHVDDEAEMTHYDLEAEAVETIQGYQDAEARGLMTDVTFKDGTYRLRYEMTGNKIEINKTAEGVPRIPAKMGKIVVKMVPGSNPEDVKRTDKAAGALVAGIWNHTNDMYKAARSNWRNYGCVEIVAIAPKMRLKKGERIIINAETVHKQDGGKVNARLEAGALDATVSPENQQASPGAKFTFVHGDLEKSDFTVESFSKRGIGIGGLEFITEQACNGGVSGKIEISMRKTEAWTKVTKKGEHISDQYYSGTAEYKWSFDYNAAFNVVNSPADANEDGSISATLKGAVQAKAARLTDEKDNWTTTTDCFPDPPRTAGKNSFSLIKEEGALTSTIDDGMLLVEGSKFRLTFGVPEIAVKRTHRTSVKPFGWCMMDQNPPSDETDESEMSFSHEAVEIEGAIDPKNPNSITGTKTYTDELGNEVTLSWALRICK
jgi:chaperonin cofactor prefoldin